MLRRWLLLSCLTIFLCVFLESFKELIVIKRWHLAYRLWFFGFFGLILLFSTTMLALLIILTLLVFWSACISSVITLHCSFIELLNILDHSTICLQSTAPNFIDVIEELRELRKHIEELSNGNHTKLLSLSFSSESFESKLKSDILKSSIDNTMLDYSSKELGYLF